MPLVVWALIAGIGAGGVGGFFIGSNTTDALVMFGLIVLMLWGMGLV